MNWFWIQINNKVDISKMGLFAFKKINLTYYMLIAFFSHEILFGLIKRIVIYMIGKGGVYFIYSSLSNILPLFLILIIVATTYRLPLFNKTAPLFTIITLLNIIHIFNFNTPVLNSIASFMFIFSLMLYFIVFSYIISRDNDVVLLALKRALKFTFPIVSIYHIMQYYHGPFPFELDWAETSASSSVWLQADKTGFRPFSTFEGPPYLNYYYLLCAVFVLSADIKLLNKVVFLILMLILSSLTFNTTITVASIISIFSVICFGSSLKRIKMLFAIISVSLIMFLFSFKFIYDFTSQFALQIANPIIANRVSLGTFAGRLSGFNDIINLISDNVFGYGTGYLSITNLYFDNANLDTLTVGDNQYLTTAFNIGIIAVIVLIMFYYKSITISLKYYSLTSKPFYRYAAAVPLTLLIAFISSDTLSYKFVMITSMAIIATIYSKKNYCFKKLS